MFGSGILAVSEPYTAQQFWRGRGWTSAQSCQGSIVGSTGGRPCQQSRYCKLAICKGQLTSWERHGWSRWCYLHWNALYALSVSLINMTSGTALPSFDQIRGIVMAQSNLPYDENSPSATLSVAEMRSQIVASEVHAVEHYNGDGSLHHVSYTLVDDLMANSDPIDAVGPQPMEVEGPMFGPPTHEEDMLEGHTCEAWPCIGKSSWETWCGIQWRARRFGVEPPVTDWLVDKHHMMYLQLSLLRFHWMRECELLLLNKCSLGAVCICIYSGGICIYSYNRWVFHTVIFPWELWVESVSQPTMPWAQELQLGWRFHKVMSLHLDTRCVAGGTLVVEMTLALGVVAFDEVTES